MLALILACHDLLYGMFAFALLGLASTLSRDHSSLYKGDGQMA